MLQQRKKKGLRIAKVFVGGGEGGGGGEEEEEEGGGGGGGGEEEEEEGGEGGGGGDLGHDGGCARGQLVVVEVVLPREYS